jgi:hypothetical protein
MSQHEETYVALPTGGSAGSAMCVSSYCYICVLILLCMCSHTTICVLILLCVSSYCYLCVLILLYVSSYCYMCPHTAIYVSSYYYICVLLLKSLHAYIVLSKTRLYTTCVLIPLYRRPHPSVVYVCVCSY